jgi:hypothetical protein
LSGYIGQGGYFAPNSVCIGGFKEHTKATGLQRKNNLWVRKKLLVCASRSIPA